MGIRTQLELDRKNSIRHLKWAIAPFILAAILLIASLKAFGLRMGWSPPDLLVRVAPRFSLELDIPNVLYLLLIGIALYWPYFEISKICRISDKLTKARREAEDEDLKGSFRQK